MRQAHIHTRQLAANQQKRVSKYLPLLTLSKVFYCSEIFGVILTEPPPDGML